MTIETKKQVTLSCTHCGKSITKSGISIEQGVGNKFKMVQVSDDGSYIQYYETPFSYSLYGGEFCNFGCYLSYIGMMNAGAE
jgi:hypothetical protein